MGGLDKCSTKTNHQIESIGFLINQSDPTNGEGSTRTELKYSIGSNG